MRIGIDLGGTKTEIICLGDDGQELYRKRNNTPKNNYSETIRNMVALVEGAEAHLQQQGTVGVGIPGTVSSVTGLVKNANSVWLNGNPLQNDLAKALGRDVKVENDANCLAVSEATDGAGAGLKNVFAIIIGTGCGAGIAIDGKPVSGLNGIAGEWAHNPLPFAKVYGDAGQGIALFDSDADSTSATSPTYAGKYLGDKGGIVYSTFDEREVEFPGPKCYCGKRGCIEKWISGTGFRQEFNRVNSYELSNHEIVEAARQGELDAQGALSRYFDRFARAVSGVINILDPDIVVVGGGMSNVAELYTEVPKAWGKYIFSDTIATKLVPAKFGDSSGVRGAAWLWN